VPVSAEVFGTRAAADQARAVQDVRRDGRRGRAERVLADVRGGAARRRPIVQHGNHGRR